MVLWNEYVGLKRRGDPKNLYLEPCDLAKSKCQSNGGVSPPYTAAEWKALAEKRPGQESAMQIPGVEKDFVIRHAVALTLRQ